MTKGLECEVILSEEVYKTKDTPQAYQTVGCPPCERSISSIRPAARP
jgi:hypothetical protein